MPGNNETTAKIGIDISDFKKGIAEANRAIKLANAEFKSASASMDKWSNSTSGLTAKISQTEKVLAANEKKLELYRQEMEAVTKEYGENSKEADNARIKYENQRAVVVKAEKDLAHYKDSLVKLEVEQKAAAEAAKLQENAYNSLQREIKSQESDLAKLKAEYSNIVVEQGKDSKSAQDLAKQITALSEELRNNQAALSKADEAADALDKSLKDSGNSANEAGEGFTVLKGALADLVSAGIQKAATALVDLGKAAYTAYQEYDEGADSIIAATGATGEAAEGLMDVYKNVSKNVVASYDEIGSAVGEINTRFEVTGDELESLSTDFIKFAKLNNTDVKNSIDTVQSAMAAWDVSASDTSLMLDVLNKAGQDTGVSVDRLSDSLVANAPALKEMNFNVSDAAMFLANLEKSGVDASATMGGLKKALNNAAAEGKPMAEALSEMEDSIKNASSSTEAITTATELFGSKAGAAIATAVRDGRLSFEELGTSMSDFEGNVNSTFENTLDGPDKFNQLIQDVKTEFASALDEFFTEYQPEIEEVTDDIINNIIPNLKDGLGWLIDNMPVIEAGIAGITTAIIAFNAVAVITKAVNAWKAFKEAEEGATVAQWLLNTAMAANPIGLIAAGIVAVTTALVVLYKKSETFRNFVNGIFDFFKNNWQDILLFLVNPFAGFFKYAYEHFDGFREFVDSTIATVKEFFSELWEGMKQGAVDAWTAITSVFVKIPEWFESKFKKAWQKVKDVFSTGGKIFDGIKEGILDALKNVVNAIIRGLNKIIAIPFKGINKALDTIRNIEILGAKPFSGLLPSIDIPQIPLLAQGGVVKKGQMALLEGSGAEAVIPLENNKRWINATANALKIALAGEGIIGGTTQQVVNNTYEFVQNNNSPKALDPLTVYRQTNSLLFAAQARLD